MTNQTSRRRFLTALGAVGASATIIGSLSACGTPPAQRGTASSAPAAGAGSAAPSKDGTITAGISYELGTSGFDPMTTTAALTLAANWHTMEGLTEILPSGNREVYPALGKELPKKVDDTTYEVTLRDGAVFHDGTPVTMDDVLFSFKRVLDPASKSFYTQFLTFIDNVAKKDDKTVTIKLKFPFSLVAERIAVVKIVPQAAATKDAKAFDANPVGTGPYKMTDNSATSKEIKFERFDKYTGKRPALAAKMVWKVMPDAATRTNALTSKAVQAMDLVPELSIETLKASSTVDAAQGFALVFAMFNCGSKPFDNVKNRQGFMYALDMAKVIQTAYLGNAAPATSFVQETHPAYKKAATVYTYDVAKAKALFAETGLKSIRVMGTNHGFVKAATPLIKQQLEAAGLSVEFTEKTSADAYAAIDGKPEAYDVLIAPGDPSVFGQDVDLLMRWWYANDVWTDKRMHWKGQESFTKVQSLLDDAQKLTGDAQKAKWGELYDIIAANIPLYPLFHRKSATAYDKASLPGFKAISLTGLSFLDVSSTK